MKLLYSVCLSLFLEKIFFCRENLFFLFSLMIIIFIETGKYTPQYAWLEKELPKVNRAETPWLIVLLHSPWYNSNSYHYMEGESMRVAFESWFVQHKVDLVVAGHVHSYERTVSFQFQNSELSKLIVAHWYINLSKLFQLLQNRFSNVQYNITNGISTPVKDPSAPVYLTIGDGGNIEGLADRWASFIIPQNCLLYFMKIEKLQFNLSDSLFLFVVLLNHSLVTRHIGKQALDMRCLRLKIELMPTLHGTVTMTTKLLLLILSGCSIDTGTQKKSTARLTRK